MLYHLQITAGLSESLKPATIRAQQFKPFPKHHRSFTYRTTQSIYTLNNSTDITQPCLTNIFRKPHTHINSLPDTRSTIYIKIALHLTIFLQLHTLLASATCHADQSYHAPFPNPTPKIHLSHSLDTSHTPAFQQTLDPCTLYTV